MSTLIVSDVFEAYYDGRKSTFAAEGVKPAEAGKREEKLRAEQANKDQQVAKAA